MEEVTEDLSAVSTVDFFDDEVDRVFAVTICADVCVCEDLRDEFIIYGITFFRRLVTAYESGIIVVWVEGCAEDVVCKFLLFFISWDAFEFLTGFIFVCWLFVPDDVGTIFALGLFF